VGGRIDAALRPGMQPGDTDRRSGRQVLAVLLLAVVGFAFQQTAIVPAVHSVQQSLHGSREWSAWLVTVYLIVATVATPAMGRLADLHGRRRMLLIGLAIFVAGSVVAALAPNMPVLLCCRAVQGVGGSVYPLCLAIARENVPRERVTAAIGILTGGFGLGTSVGFVAGGLLAQYASWRWIFVAGAVVVAGGTVLARRVPDSGERAGGGFDLAGTALLSLAVVGVLTALTLVVPLGWASPLTVGLLAATLLALAGWLHLERTRTDPLIDVHVLRERQVAIVNFATIGLGWALFSSYLLIPMFVQHPSAHGGFGLGGGAAVTGLLLIPLAIAQMAAAPFAAWLSLRLGARPVFGCGMVAVAVAFGLLMLTARSPALLAGASALLGAGAGLGLQAGSSVATQGVAGDVAAVSSAVNSTVRRLAGGIGGQVSTIMLTAQSRAEFVAAYAVAAGLTVAGAVLISAPLDRAGTGDGHRNSSVRGC
jgi:MFS family permease